MPLWSKKSEQAEEPLGAIPRSVRDDLKRLIIGLSDIPPEHHKSIYMSAQVAIGGGAEDELVEAIKNLRIDDLSDQRIEAIASEVFRCARRTHVSDRDRQVIPDKGVIVMEVKGQNGKFVLTGDKLTISRKGTGLLTLVNLGLQGDKVIPVHQITAVELRKPGLARGYLRLSINGRDPIGGLTEAIRDENALLLGGRDYKDAEKFKDALLSIIASKHPAQQASPISIADELTKLADLQTKGILTEAEFTAEKMKLLNR